MPRVESRDRHADGDLKISPAKIFSTFVTLVSHGFDLGGLFFRKIWFLSGVEVRISEKFEIRIYSDHFGDRLPMPQIRIFEVTIFRVFFCDFYKIVYQFVSGQEFIY